MAAPEGDGLRIVFMGTPGFAAKVLARLLDWPGCLVAAAFTQPDRPCGRGQVCRPSEVKVLARKRGIPVFQPEDFKSDEALALVRDQAPDLLVVAAYGLILPQAVLDAAPLGAVNVHASLLPRLRGAAPIQRAIQQGDQATGITIMQMNAGLDTGDILLQRALAIGAHDTAQTLHDELADMGGRLLVEALERLAENRLTPVPQDNARATYAPKLSKHEAEVRWDCPAQAVHDQIRSMHPWPGAYCLWQRPDGSRLRLGLALGRVGPERPPGAEPGSFLGLYDDCLAVACADKVYLVPSLTPAGRKAMSARGFWCGYMPAGDPGQARPDDCAGPG